MLTIKTYFTVGTRQYACRGVVCANERLRARACACVCVCTNTSNEKKSSVDDVLFFFSPVRTYVYAEE